MPSPRQELNELGKLCKYLDEPTKKIMRSYYSLCDKLILKVNSLENEVRSLRQTDLLKQKPMFEAGKSMSKSLETALSSPPSEPYWKYLKRLIEDPLADQEKLKLWMKWGKYKTIVDVRKRINELEEEENARKKQGKSTQE